MGYVIKNTFLATEMLSQLISFDATSSKSNKPVIKFISKFLNEHNIASNIGSDLEGSKGGLIATIVPIIKGGIVLSGHTDTVPVDGQKWESNSFLLTKK